MANWLKQPPHQTRITCRSILASDPGASLLGEVAFGTNPGITQFTNDIFWDEKIYGTVHIALGRSYANAMGDHL